MEEVGRPITPTEEAAFVRVARHRTPDSKQINKRKVQVYAKDMIEPSNRRKRTAAEQSVLEECHCQVCLRKCTPLSKYQFGQRFCSEECYEFI